MNVKTVISSLFKALAIVLVLAVVFPSVVKLSHAFNHHEHQVCIDDTIDHSTHFHQTDADCDFYKFKLTKTQYLAFNKYEVNINSIEVNRNSKYYNSFYNHQQNNTFLRGPPELV